MKKDLLTIDIEEYGGKEVAILDGKIVASGETLQEVLKAAKQQYPDRSQEEFKILAVPQTIPFIYLYGA